ncbi:MAG: methyl-accepting chemotaxis protein [Phycisphaerales bacterium]|jgi:methyl-accepting chemotaxis protein|nr:methyl-accepting chemotaxis protein [Phycisphaerales bacterium]
MNSNQLPFQHRVAGRLLLFAGIPIVLILVLIGLTSFERTGEYVRNAVEQQVLDASRWAAFDLADENLQAVTAARMLAKAAESGFHGDRGKSLDLARRVLIDTPALQATYFGWESRADDPAALTQSESSASMDDSGRFLPYWHRDANASEGITLEPLVGVDDPDSLYYRETQRIFEETGVATSVVTKPYTYEGVPLIEHTHPIVVDGEFVGIAGVDRSLAGLQSRLQMIQSDLGEESDLFLLTRGLFIATTADADVSASDRLQETEVGVSPYASLFDSFAERSRTEDSFVLESLDPVLGAVCIYAVSTVRPGDWTLVVRQPISVVEAPARSLLTNNAIIILIGLVVVGAILFFVSKPMIGRIERSAGAVQRVAEGQLCTEIDADSARDETGVLARGVLQMTTRLRSLAEEVRSARSELDQVAQEVIETSDREAEAASGFGASTTEIAAAVREIAATTSELAEEVRRVDKRAADTARTMNSDRSRLEDMSGSMHAVEEATSGIGSRLGDINRRAAEITGVVETIGRIAEQTNLLSVNAAIEAEKAGEYGTGFLVVAREIRRLADQTANATGDISATVSEMQSAVSSGVMEMDRYTDRVRRAVEQASEVSDGLATAINAASENAAAFGRVADGVDSQAVGAKQIDEAMSGLSTTADSAHESSRRLQEVSSRLTSAINMLAGALANWNLDEHGSDCS